MNATAGEEQVHVQAPPPGQVLGQRPAQQQAHRAAGPGDRAVHRRTTCARSFGSVNVVASSDSADGTSSAANAPWQARAVTSMGKFTEAPPMAETAGEPGHAGQEHHLAADHVGQLAAQQQQAAERQRVRGDHPLPVRQREVQRPLRRGQRDVHDRRVQHDHQLRQADHTQDQPAPSAQATVNGSSIRRHAPRLACPR